MNAWILYDHERIAINRKFAEFLLAAFDKFGVSARLVIAEEQAELPNEPFPDLAVMRSVSLPISLYLESAGVMVWNNSFVSHICNDKWKTYQFLDRNGITSLPSFLINRENIETLSIDYPVVIKSRDGHGGTEVFKAETTAELRENFFRINKPTAICQQLASNPGKDLRVYLLGKRILCGMLRESDSDFRSNFCLGGKAVRYDPLPAYVTNQVKKIAELFSFGLVGIDFVFHNSLPVFNEIEDVVGTRMLYAKTEINPAELYVQFIIDKIKNRNPIGNLNIYHTHEKLDS